MTTSMTTRAPSLPPFPRPSRLLYSLGAWKELVRAGGARIMREHLEWNLAAASLYVEEGNRVLDVGCWDGSLAQALAECKKAEVEGVDVVDKNRSDIPFRVFDGRQLPYEDGEQFDRILFMYVLHHSAHAEELLVEAKRLLAPGGVIVLAEDMVENRWQRLHTIAFHVWLFAVTFMGWKGSFRKVADWRRTLANAGLELRWVHKLGRQGKRIWFPLNMVLVATPIDAPEAPAGELPR